MQLRVMFANGGSIVYVIQVIFNLTIYRFMSYLYVFLFRYLGGYSDILNILQMQVNMFSDTHFVR